MFAFLKHRNVVGLDIGNHTLKVIQLTTQSERPRLLNLAVASLPPQVQDEADPVLRNELVAETIKRLFKDNGIKAKDVVTAISGDNAIVRYVKLPYMNKDELKNVISYEAEQYIPLAIDQVVLDFEILGEMEEEGQRKIEVLLVAAKEDVIEQHIELLKLAELNPFLIDVDTFALSNAFEFNYGRSEGETIGLINIGSKLTTINIVESGVSHLTRDVAVAGINFSREIQREFASSLAEAETLKCQDGEVMIESDDIMQMEIPDQADNSARIGEAITPVLNKLVAEIQRSFDYYQSSIRKSDISRIVLSGGAAQLKNLDRYLAEKLNVPVDMNDPFKNITIPEKEFDLDFIRAHSPQFAVGVGLSLRQTG